MQFCKVIQIQLTQFMSPFTIDFATTITVLAIATTTTISTVPAVVTGSTVTTISTVPASVVTTTITTVLASIATTTLATVPASGSVTMGDLAAALREMRCLVSQVADLVGVLNIYLKLFTISCTNFRLQVEVEAALPQAPLQLHLKVTI